MSNFWVDKISDKLEGKGISEAWKKLSKEATLRPTIYIGLGGYGCTVVRKLKKAVHELIPDKNARDLFAFIGMDTHSREQRDVLTKTEYVELSIGITPDEVSKDPHYSEYLGWYRDMISECKWKAPSIEGGASKVKALGRIALLYPPTVDRFYNTLQSALNKVLANLTTTASPKVYIVSSIAGGTGAGTLLDVFIIANQLLFTQLRTKYRMQAILATPEALEGDAPVIDLPDFYSNTYVTLKELFHFINNEQEVFSYACTGPGFASLQADKGHMPSNIFLVTDRNSDGQIIHKTLPELGEMVVSYLLFEIQSPVKTIEGAPKAYDSENTAFSEPGHDLMPRAFSSLGVVRFGLPHEKIEELFVNTLVFRTIDDELKGYQIVPSYIENWINKNSLIEVGSDQLQEKIRLDKRGNNIRITVDVEGKLKDLKRTELGKACNRLKSNMQVSIKEQYKKVLTDSGKKILAAAQKSLENDSEQIYGDETVGHVLEFLKSVWDALKIHNEAISKELNENTLKLQNAEQKLNKSIELVTRAAASGFWGRKEKIRLGKNVFDGDLKTFLNQQLLVWSQEEGNRVYNNLIGFCEKQVNTWTNLHNVLLTRNNSLKNSITNLAHELNSMADIQMRGPGNRISLLDFQKISELYSDFFDEETERAIIAKTATIWKRENIMKDHKLTDAVWVEKAAKNIKEEVKKRLDGLNIMKILEKFYGSQASIDRLFGTILALGEPLFPLIPGKEEKQYRTDRILAVYPSIQKEFEGLFNKYKDVDEGVCNAYFHSPHEIIIYTVTQGYTLHSLSRIYNYKAHYDHLLDHYETLISKRKTHRPIHGWLDADEWEEVIPKPQGEEEANKWFTVGRAFSYLFPSAVTQDGSADSRKNKAFIYNRGSNYYLLADTGRGKGEAEKKLGSGIEVALEKFDGQPEWVNQVKENALVKVHELGADTIRKKLSDEYLPIIEAEFETAKRSRDKTRQKILNKLKNSLTTFMEEELKQVRV